MKSEPSWSSDGQFIFYLACPRIMEGNYGGHGKCHLYRSNPSGNDELGLLRAITYSIDSYDVSPDEQKIVFAISGQYSYQ